MHVFMIQIPHMLTICCKMSVVYLYQMHTKFRKHQSRRMIKPQNFYDLQCIT